MIEIEVRDGLYHVRGPKIELCLTKAEFIQALRRAKWVKRQQRRAARVAPNAASDPLAYGYHQRAGRTFCRVSPISLVNSSSFAVTVAPGITAQLVSAVASLAQARKPHLFFVTWKSFCGTLC
jgi:hypothetical protein